MPTPAPVTATGPSLVGYLFAAANNKGAKILLPAPTSVGQVADNIPQADLLANSAYAKAVAAANKLAATTSTNKYVVDLTFDSKSLASYISAAGQKTATATASIVGALHASTLDLNDPASQIALSTKLYLANQATFVKLVEDANPGLHVHVQAVEAGKPLLTTYKAALAAVQNDPTLVDVAPSPKAPNLGLTLADYKANPNFVAAVEASGYVLTVSVPSAKFIDFHDFYTSTTGDSTVKLAFPATTKLVASLDSGFTSLTQFQAALHDPEKLAYITAIEKINGAKFALTISNPATDSVTVAVADEVFAHSVKVVITPATAQTSALALSIDDYFGSGVVKSAYVAALETAKYKFTVSFDPTVNSAAQYLALAKDLDLTNKPNVTINLVTPAPGGVHVAIPDSAFTANLAYVKALNAKGYLVDVVTADASFASFSAASAKLGTGPTQADKVVLAANAVSPTLKLSEFSALNGTNAAAKTLITNYISAVEGAGLDINVIANNATKAKFDLVTKAINDAHLSSDAHIHAVLPHNNAISISVADFHDAAYLAALEAAGNTFIVTATTAAEVNLVADELLSHPLGTLGAALTGASAGQTLTISSYMYSANGVLTSAAKNMEATAGVKLVVKFDPTKSTIADFTLADKDAKVIDLSVDAAQPGEVETVAVSTLTGAKLVAAMADAKAYVDALHLAHYDVQFAANGVSYAAYTAAKAFFTAADGDLTAGDVIVAPAGAVVPPLTLVNFADAGYVAFLEATYSSIQVVADGATPDAYAAALAAIGTDVHVTVILPKGPQTVNLTDLADYQAQLASGYLDLTVKATGYTINFPLDPLSEDAILAFKTIKADARIKLNIEKASVNTSDTISINAADFLANKAGFVKAVVKAGYKFEVSLDPTDTPTLGSTFLDYKAIIAPGVTVIVPDGNNTAIASIALSDFLSTSGPGHVYATLLQNAHYNVNLTLADATPLALFSAISTIDGLVAPSGTHFTLQLSDAQLDAAISEPTLALDALSNAGISEITGQGLTLTTAQLATLDAAGIHFVDALSDVTLNVTQANLDSLLGGASPVTTWQLDHVDHLNFQGSVAEINDVEAAALIDHGLSFVSTDLVHLEHDAASGATHLDTSLTLKNLNGLGVTSVTVINDPSHVLVVDGTDASAGDFAGVGAGLFAPGLKVELDVNQGQLADVVANAGHLHDANISTIGSASGSLEVSLDQAQTLDAAGLTFDTSGGAYDPFTNKNATDVTLDVNQSDLPGNHAGSEHDTTQATIDTATHLHVDHIDVRLADGNQAHVAIDEMAAQQLIDAGVDFGGAVDEHVTLVAGTHLDTSAKHLQELSKLGVDEIRFDLTKLVTDVDLSHLPGVGAVDFTTLTNSTNISIDVVVTEAQLESNIARNVDVTIDKVTVDLNTSLTNNHVMGAEGVLDASLQSGVVHDHLTLGLDVDNTGAAVTLQQIVDAADGDLTTFTTAEDLSLGTLVSVLHGAGIVDINLKAGSHVTLTDTEVSTLLDNQLLSANGAANVDLTIGGAHSAVSLAEMSELGVDQVFLTAATTMIDVGVEFSTVKEMVDFFKNEYEKSGPALLSTASDNKTVVLDLGHLNVNAVLADKVAVQELKLIGVDKISFETAGHVTVTKDVPH